MEIINKKCAFEDERGEIIDILENEAIEYVTFISSRKGAIRGNHYHNDSIQYAFVLKGSLKVITQIPGSEVESKIARSGDLIFTPQREKHVLIALEDSEFLVLTRGPRGGKNYETDTFRLTGSESLLAKGEGIL
ncbi:Cupin [uncultured archaeon]|nr:Cupin [uncultured archaeon]